jgi:hypothetical protein
MAVFVGEQATRAVLPHDIQDRVRTAAADRPVPNVSIDL